MADKRYNSNGYQIWNINNKEKGITDGTYDYVKSDDIKQQNSSISNSKPLVDSKMNTENPTVGSNPTESWVSKGAEVIGSAVGVVGKNIFEGAMKTGEYIGATMAKASVNPEEAVNDVVNDAKSAITYTQKNKFQEMSTNAQNKGSSSTFADSSKSFNDVTSVDDDSQTMPDTPDTKVEQKDSEIISEGELKLYSNLTNIDKEYGTNIIKAVIGDHNYTSNNKKVSLNVAPINKTKGVTNYITVNEWNSRLSYILGDDTSKLLYTHFKDTGGLVFPYTPDIEFQHTVNYEETDILHSNLAVQHYKNTPPPTISLKADFTADTPENGEYMYAVIHFLRSISKCEFGEKVAAYSSITGIQSGGNNREAVPPPILYLNGWGNLIENIPVVITSFGISLGKEKHYVELPNKNIWLPTDITITIQMKIQFNLDMYKRLFDLNDYKNLLMFGEIQTIDNGKGKEKSVKYLSNIVSVKGYNITKEGKNKTISESSTTRRYNGAGWTW